jgi:hypothetical protein
MESAHRAAEERQHDDAQVEAALGADHQEGMAPVEDHHMEAESGPLQGAGDPNGPPGLPDDPEGLDDSSALLERLHLSVDTVGAANVPTIIVDRHSNIGDRQVELGPFEQEEPVDLEQDEYEEDDSPDMPDLTDADFLPDFSQDFLENPPSSDAEDDPMDLSFLKPITCASWRDFIDEFVDCTGPIDKNLAWTDASSGSSVKPIHLSTLEQVIYGTNIALVAQWNLSQSAIQFNMTQAWNLFRYGVMVGQAQAHGDKTSTQPPPTSLADAFSPSASAVRTLRSAERHLFPDFKDLLVVHAACSNSECQHVFHNIKRLADFKVGSPCSVCLTVPDGDRNVGLVPFPRMTLAMALERLLQITGVEELCEQANERRQGEEEFDRRRYPDIQVYRDAYSGTDWDLKSDQHPVDESEFLLLHVDFGIDWYQPSRTNGARMQSIGPIIGHVTNLPQRLRATPSLALLLGITPGAFSFQLSHPSPSIRR